MGGRFWLSGGDVSHGAFSAQAERSVSLAVRFRSLMGDAEHGVVVRVLRVEIGICSFTMNG